MPELLALVACEKVLIDEEKNPSLIVLMERVEVQVPEGQQVPANVLAPKEWMIFTLWKRKDGEELGHCKQLIDIAPPGDARKVEIEAEFDFNERMHKITNKIVGIPVGSPGICWINVRLESAIGVTETFSYPLEILHKSVPLDSLPKVVASETPA